MKIARVIDSQHRLLWASLQEDGRLLRMDGDPLLQELTLSEEELEPIRWLPPIEPRAILCIGLNYRRHAEESNAQIPENPVVFMKNPCAAVGHLDPIVIPRVCGEELDYEAELAVVIGRPCRDAAKEDALSYVLGYTLANDVSARIWQSQLCGGQWVRGKSFDTFAPLGPVLITPDEVPAPNSLPIRSILNGQTMQSSSTDDMIFDIPTLIHFLSQDTTLLPGTAILTGTPEGVGWFRETKVILKPGDTIAIEIDGIGRLENPVQAAS